MHEIFAISVILCGLPLHSVGGMAVACSYSVFHLFYWIEFPINWIPVNIGTGKHFSNNLNSHIKSDGCMENLKILAFKCPNE